MSFLFTFIIVIIIGYLIFNRKPSQNHTGNDNTPRRPNRYARWIGGGVGWAFGGPLGALLGFALGSMFQDIKSGKYEYVKSNQQGDFHVSLLVLSAAVMKADNSVRNVELDYVKRFFVSNFGVKAAQEYILMLREILKQEIQLAEVSQQIGRYMDYSSKLQLLHYLFGIAGSDGNPSVSELDVLRTIANYMGITNSDFDSIKAMFVKETDSAYKVLEIDPNATEEDIKRAYRIMAMKYHPDKVSYLGEDVQKAAETKFKEVTIAYETIKKQRGFN